MDVSGAVFENTIMESLGIEAVEMTPDRSVMQLEVGPKVHQPMGLLHGGASAVLAEGAASMGAWMSCDPDQYAVGIELNVSHLRPKRDGLLRATATPVRRGRTIHVWNVDLSDENGDPVAVARCTVAIRQIEPGKA